jgi:hypothetical protein
MRRVNLDKAKNRPNAVIPINWKKVDEMLKVGCPGVEIAAYLGMSPDNLYRRCEKEHQLEFSAYAAQKRALGANIVRKVQYDVAVNDRENTMLIWVGKQLCDQREPESRTAEICRPALLEFLDKLKKSTE